MGCTVRVKYHSHVFVVVVLSSPPFPSRPPRGQGVGNANLLASFVVCFLGLAANPLKALPSEGGGGGALCKQGVGVACPARGLA